MILPRTHSGVCHSDLGVMTNSVCKTSSEAVVHARAQSEICGTLCTVGRPTISYAAGPGRRARGRREGGQARPRVGPFDRQGRRSCRCQMDFGHLWELRYVQVSLNMDRGSRGYTYAEIEGNGQRRVWKGQMVSASTRRLAATTPRERSSNMSWDPLG